MAIRPITIFAAVVAVTVAVLFNPVRQRMVVLGILRGHIENIHGVEQLRVIAGTTMCEDLHLERTTSQLFAACQDAPEERARWFPPLEVFADHQATGGGSIVRVDPVSMTATTLRLEGFTGPLVTHGIDILNDPDDPHLLWIYAVNHLPNPERWQVPTSSSSNLPPETARIEIFSHVLGSEEAEHIRSIQHPSIRMPNDVLAMTPSSFYVTNDHVHYEGLKRAWEDAGTQSISPTPDTVFVEIADMQTKDPSVGLSVKTALEAVHNNNGLGRGSISQPDEVVVIDAGGGVMVRTRRDLSPGSPDKSPTIIERIQMDSTLDNPSYYDDPYATPSNNASGYILPGLALGAKMMGVFPHNDRPIPSLVWHVRSNGASLDIPGRKNQWEKRLIFQDDGKALRSASGAVLVGIDPKENGGRKQGWLFVTGFGSFNMVAAKIDL